MLVFTGLFVLFTHWNSPLLVVTLLLHIVSNNCHPLCLDAEPPFSFKGSEAPLDFCTEYSSFGCCTREDDQRIKAVYDDYVTKTPSTSSNCTSYLRTLLCLECSPYAAHIFDAEGATTATSRNHFPGLCENYCIGLYRNCKNVIPYVSNSGRIQEAMAAGEQSFCAETRISDMTYCYPDIINNTDLNQTLHRQQSSEQGCLCLEPLASQLRNALLLVYPDDNSGRLFIGEQLGLVSIYYKNGTRFPELFMDISNLVLTSSSPGDERGFLGMACHPRFASTQKLYVYFTIGQSGNFRTRISEFRTMASNPNKVDKNSERVLLEIQQPYSNHNGGQMLFGFDGYLYVTIGDGGAGGDPNNYAQNLTTLLGKVLRIDVDIQTNNRQYGIPPDNPFVSNSAARPEIYAYGTRNMWRCSFDRGDFQTGAGKGRLFCGDVGQARYEEIDIIKSGLNYGWRAREGFECYDSNMCGRIGPEELPIFAYGRDLGQSVTGGYIYRGCNYPSLNGLYIYGDYNSGRIFRLKDTGASVWENKEILMCGSDYCTNGLRNTYERNILSFGEDYDGDVYVLTTSNPSPTSFSGSVYRLVDPLRRNDPKVCSRSSTQKITPPTTTQSTSATPTTSKSTPKPTTTSRTTPLPTSATSSLPDTETTAQFTNEISFSTATFTPSWKGTTLPSTSTTRPLSSTSTQSDRSSTSSAAYSTAATSTKHGDEATTSEVDYFTHTTDATWSAPALLEMAATTTSDTSSQIISTTDNGFDLTSPPEEDEVSHTESFYTSDPTVGPTNNSTAVWSCDFENSTESARWCGIQQATDDNFDWTVFTGPTPSDPTGPDKAYSGQFYIYIEASNPRRVNDTAKISLPIPPNTVSSSGTFCLTFAYHMFGFHIRELRLIIEHSPGGATVIWRQVKQKGNFWLRAAVTLILETGSKVGFIGIRGDEFSGDIGLDDLKLQIGPC